MSFLPRLEVISVGAAAFARAGLAGDFVNIDLWAEDSSGLAMEQCGSFLQKGPFRGSWTALLRVCGDDILNVAGTHTEAVLTCGRSTFSVMFEYRLLRGNLIKFSTGKEQWVALFPRAMMTDGPRSTDKYVTFTGRDEFKLCVFPAEHYDVSEVAPIRRPNPILSHEVARLVQKNCPGAQNPELQCVALAAGFV